MNVYFSGLGGVGIGPLTQIARDAGHTVVGSDLEESMTTKELQSQGISVNIGQDGSFFREQHDALHFDWFVHTAALPPDHPELLAAKKLGVRTAKRDEFLAYFIEEHNLKLIAISGTHGKTTTTGMFVWALKQLDVPISYSVGSTLSFGSGGFYDPESEYFIYECDEYDRNMLHFSPYLSLLPAIDYDHPDTYPTEASYKEAFQRYVAQSQQTVTWQSVLDFLGVSANDAIWGLQPNEVAPVQLPGEHNRRNATLVIKGLEYLGIGDLAKNSEILSNFPGTGRRFEKLGENLYTDYGHHPEEIAVTLQAARELNDKVVLIYQPHQNWRQHFIKDQYTTQFEDAAEIYWVPTYLTRENPDQPTLTPEQLTENLTNKEVLHFAELNDDLWNIVQQRRDEGYLVLCMGAGTIDKWVRDELSSSTHQDLAA